MKPRVILFDADGMTLLPKRFSDQLQIDYGISWEKLKPFFTGPFQACKRGKADLKEELPNVIAEWGWNGTVNELLAYWFPIGSTINPEIQQIILDLKAQGIHCLLATNQERYRAAYLREEIGLENLFHGLLVSAELGYLKNEPGFFETAYQRLQTEFPDLQREHILFIDHEEENLAIAKQASLQTYHYHDIPSFKILLRHFDE